ncbi:MAG: PQQ-binding-like beta-propeller repeat protein [Prosthecobacter sp.]|nr:PQQ-binding-like beta-propeller repeat protein [Prosthecobacter sp.]
MNSRLSLCFLYLGLSAWQSAAADDWPQWRGPERDGVWRETGVVEAFASPELKPLWTAPISAGYCGPTVAGDRVLVMDRVTMPEAQERVLCFDRKNGKALWTQAYACIYHDLDYALGPRASVTVADGRAFAFGAMGHATCLDVTDGKVLWARDLATELRATINVWGVTAAPLVAGDLVIFQIGGQPDACLVALEVKTGKERWRALDGRASYSAPRLIQSGGRSAVLAWTGNWLACLDPATGKVFWKEAFKPNKMVINVPDPVLDETGSKVFLTSFYDGSFCFVLKPDFSPPDFLWARKGMSERKTDALHCMIMTPFIRDGHVYGIDSYGEMRCLNLATGDRVWEDTSLLANGRWATAYFVQNGDRTWITTEKGEIVIAKLTPQGFQRLSSAQFLAPNTTLRGRNHPIAWSHPAYAGKCLFARNDRELICVSLAADRP